MKRRLLGFLLGAILIFVCAGCGAKSTNTEQTEAAQTTTTEENSPKQSVEATATPVETESPTPEKAEEPSEEIAPEAEVPEATSEPTSEPEPVEESAPEPTAEPIPEPQVVYTYTDISATMYATQTVNVRSLPNTDGEKMGSLSTNQEIAVTGQCNETGWYMFDYNGQTAFVSNSYLSTEKVEVQQAPPAQEAAQVSNVPNIADYPERTWIDMGDYFFYITPADADGKYCVPYDYCDGINVILEQRFPGNWTSSHGFYTSDNKLVSLGQKNMPNPACQAFVDANCR